MRKTVAVAILPARLPLSDLAPPDLTPPEPTASSHAMIYLLRHGQTQWNAEGRYQGWRDSPLTQRGQTQARAAGRRLRDLIADMSELAVVTSTLGRAQHSASLALFEMGLGSAPVSADDRLKEIGLGLWEGVLDDDIQAQWADLHAARRRDPWTVAPPGGETHTDVLNRVSDWLAEQSEHRTLLVVTHGVAGRLLRGRYLGLSPEEIRALPTFGQDEIHILSNGKSETVSTLADV